VLDGFDILLEEQPSPELKQATDSINEYIADVMANAKARKTRKENNREEENNDDVIPTEEV